MKKLSLSKLGVLMVSCTALAAITASQIASAQQRVRYNGNRLIGARRITPTDPSFRSATALVLSDVKDKILGHKIDMDMQGAFVWSDTIWNTTKGDNSLFTKTIFWFSPDQRGERAQPMTAAQFAIAQAIFSQVNMSKARGVNVTSRGISGRITAKELGMNGRKITEIARANVQKEIDLNNEALQGLQGR